MTPGGRLTAAIEILDDILTSHRPAAESVRDWGRSHRFAGSSDRAAIGNLVNAALRHRLSLGWIMGEETPRALAIGALAHVWKASRDDVLSAADGGRFSPSPLTPAEQAAIADNTRLDAAPAWVAGDIPEWLAPAFAAAFGEAAVEQGRGLAGRAPLDIRANTLKTTREKLLRRLARLGSGPTRWSPIGVRFALAEGPARLPPVEAETAHGRGHFEVQDEGSQIAALLAAARPGAQVVDYCAGAGGKTLAMAAAMENRGQIHAHDADRRRLRPMVDRLKRAGARNVQIVAPAGDGDGLDHLTGRADTVLVDAPCSGSGIWRRRPDSKWRLKPEALSKRVGEQAQLIAAASRLVRPSGRLVYVTCSVLPAENADQIRSFLQSSRNFEEVSYRAVWEETIGSELPQSGGGDTKSLLLTPATHATDGFFISILERSG